MSVLASVEHYRAPRSGFFARTVQRALPALFAAARSVWPIPSFKGTFAATRYDDVREVFATDRAFAAPYKANLDVITGSEPFFLGLGDTPEYRRQLDAMRAVVPASDLPLLGSEAERLSRARVAAAGGRIDVVELTRDTTFELLAAYFGVPEPKEGKLDVWACRLFEFQFTGSVDDAEWLAEATEFAAAFRQHLDKAIATRRANANQHDDVLARCLERQAAGEDGYSDREIRTALLCMIVGGPPQPPMVLPQAMEQLLRRQPALAAAQDAARAGDDAALQRFVREAMRFDPLAPGLMRTTQEDWRIACGTPREKAIPKGASVFAAFSSAMMDTRRIVDPQRFNAHRPDSDYLHFGHGLHECFGRHINRATLHRMLKPLLERRGLRRAKGKEGRLAKRGAFTDRLVVEYDERSEQSVA